MTTTQPRYVDKAGTLTLADLLALQKSHGGVIIHTPVGLELVGALMDGDPVTLGPVQEVLA